MEFDTNDSLLAFYETARSEDLPRHLDLPISTWYNIRCRPATGSRDNTDHVVRLINESERRLRREIPVGNSRRPTSRNVQWAYVDNVVGTT